MARQSLLEMLLPTPDQIVRSYLTTDENLVLVDRPSTNAFIVEASRQLILFVIIVMEILRTVVAHFDDAGLQLKPFLIIGIISAWAMTQWWSIAVRRTVSSTWVRLPNL